MKNIENKSTLLNSQEQITYKTAEYNSLVELESAESAQIKEYKAKVGHLKEMVGKYYMDQIQDWLTDMKTRYSLYDDIYRCRMYHIICFSTPPEEVNFLDFEGEDSIRAYIDRRLSEEIAKQSE